MTWLAGSFAVPLCNPVALRAAIAPPGAGEGAQVLANESTARDFVADAYAHLKYIGCVEAAAPLLGKAGLPEEGDEGVIRLSGSRDVPAFLSAAKHLRYWQRRGKVKQF